MHVVNFLLSILILAYKHAYIISFVLSMSTKKIQWVLMSCTGPCQQLGRWMASLWTCIWTNTVGILLLPKRSKARRTGHLSLSLSNKNKKKKNRTSMNKWTERPWRRLFSSPLLTIPSSDSSAHPVFLPSLVGLPIPLFYFSICIPNTRIQWDEPVYLAWCLICYSPAGSWQLTACFCV